MKFFLTVDGRKLKQASFILFISFFTALFFFTQASIHIPVFGTSDGPKAVFKGEKGIALTFNIGWGDIQADPILDVLEKEEVRSATFFLSGAWAERHPDTVKRIKEMGFEIGSLGYAYEDYTELDDAQVKRDIVRGIDVLKKLDIKDVTLLRSPTGHFDKRTLSIAEKSDLTVVHWSINSQDWKNPGVEVIIDHIKKAKEGDIVLMHASDSAIQTVEALPKAIALLEERAELISVSTLIANGKVKTTLIP
ncbi:polysaccharide deacetylase family protein [Bacillus sp. FJAT-50079]|uniref:polysaccharide deacetylase family protein n=1 Tax=Bacillus sp. FJAT-50079 TaxID=2833577 RepID=UPI001BC94DC0|nr:polysaccharide deacetylase family protein [Bacillus sp. FJAT-50079]MBS4210637.1 polysaccharide deacetylase family protein [Bacillus sp. FJAT-50079]